MSKFIYRDLSFAAASSVMDYCEKNNLDYDIWDGAKFLQSTVESPIQIELGVNEWDKIPTHLYKT